MSTAERAAGRWHSILVQFGVDRKHLGGKHVACPLCGGRDRFRFDDKNGEGTWYCNHCGAGDGFTLLTRLTGQTFQELAKEIDRMAGHIEPTKPKPTTDPAIRLRKVASGLQIVAGDNPVRRYLVNRGLHQIPAAFLRLHPALDYWDVVDGKTTKLGTYPAMVCKMSSRDGSMASLHVTYLTPDGQKAPHRPARKMLPPIQTLSGSAIRLTQVYPHIGIAEGVETAIAVMLLHNIPCWAAGTAGLLEAFEPPEGVERVSIFADSDENFVGQAAGYALAKKLVHHCYEVGGVFVPANPGTDFADDFAGRATTAPVGGTDPETAHEGGESRTPETGARAPAGHG
jgi:putative DNA primase/helicase